MFESPATENPFPEKQVQTVIRPRAIIRYLGASVGFLVLVPFLFFVGALLFNPAELFREFDALSLIPLAVQLALIFATYRWLTIYAKLDEENVVLRGWFKTLKFPLSDFGEIRRVYFDTYSDNLGSTQSWRYCVFNKEANQIGGVPGAMQFCRDWDGFMKKLNSFSS